MRLGNFNVVCLLKKIKLSYIHPVNFSTVGLYIWTNQISDWLIMISVIRPDNWPNRTSNTNPGLKFTMLYLVKVVMALATWIYCTKSYFFPYSIIFVSNNIMWPSINWRIRSLCLSSIFNLEVVGGWFENKQFHKHSYNIY